MDKSFPKEHVLNYFKVAVISGYMSSILISVTACPFGGHHSVLTDQLLKSPEGLPGNMEPRDNRDIELLSSDSQSPEPLQPDGISWEFQQGSCCIYYFHQLLRRVWPIAIA